VATNRLLRDLLEALALDFASNANPEDILCREQATPQIPMEENTLPKVVIVIGASHSVRLANQLKIRNLTVIDLCVPGWVASDSSLEKLESEIDKLGSNKDTTVRYSLICFPTALTGTKPRTVL
jgi:hypothetical protein